MRTLFTLFFSLIIIIISHAQEDLPADYLSAQFHKDRREALREQMPPNSVAVFFANAVRNRANDVDYIYHQDPDFYYLTGYKEPHAVLVIFSEDQKSKNGEVYNEMLYVQEKNPQAEQWNGYRLGTEGAKEKLGFVQVYNGKEFLKSGIDFTTFDEVLFKGFADDYRDNPRDPADLFSLVESFKQQTGYYLEESEDGATTAIDKELKTGGSLPVKRANLDNRSVRRYMAKLRQIKTEEELGLLKKAVRISAMGQREVMKAMHPGMSEREIQGIHEYVYKKYGSEYEGYPSIVGGGHNGCVLHYIENNKTKVGDDLVLMDLGAEYHGYTADVTRTIPANGKFNPEQKAIYDLVYEAQEAGIAASVVGNPFRSTDAAARKVINEGLVKLGIAKDETDARQYFPHGTSHHIGLDVHDPGLGENFEPNMVITVEPGIYIPEGSNCDPKWYGIAVRIEDDILITENGPVNLSAEAPRRAEEIEALMKEKSPLEAFVLPQLD
ncbi:M24 family metallopeptidase [Antarcticibacterium flavum]|uniref:Xaa-Pro aminopeptidase n=1 Tax=Antarcticibacterium flavum TaxID=2058175 RepID=A0A5B7X2A2_9FLAO|nr:MULTISPECIES: aminopeptidase P N-terminal domain-containing protein [Antarcticibacterium]MCM4159839.1 Xaa-Pro aminopeptidase [Antarcticibacterium sp. W02-3]QCY68842.1 M24 family metallopeptidase [Antarcticibacterium flavum]